MQRVTQKELEAMTLLVGAAKELLRAAVTQDRKESALILYADLIESLNLMDCRECESCGSVYQHFERDEQLCLECSEGLMARNK
jgi:hypothetical protein